MPEKVGWAMLLPVILGFGADLFRAEVVVLVDEPRKGLSTDKNRKARGRKVRRVRRTRR